MLKIYRNRYFTQNAVVLTSILFTITFLLMSKSPIHFWVGSDAETDSAVYSTIAMIMEKGYIPYRDSFDHKGPLIYLLNYLGRQISAYRGIWLIEFATLFFTLFMMYRIGRLCCSRLSTIVILLFVSAPLFGFYEQGNKVEEFAMPFIALSLYLFLDYLINRKITVCGLVLCGTCLGAVCLLRPNMISTWIVFCIAIFVLLIKQRNYFDLLRFTRYFAIGFLLFVLPFICWLAYHNALKAFWEQYMIFNAAYCGHADPSQIWHTFFYSLEHKTILFALVVVICLFIRRREKLFGIYGVYMIISCLMLSISGRTYAHYNMVTIPALIFPIAALFGLCEQQWKSTAGQTALFLLTILLLTHTLHTDWFTPMQNLAAIYQERNVDHLSEKLRTVCRLIGENTDNNDKISVYGNWNLVYVISGRMHATHYSYQYPIGAIVPEIKIQYFAELEMERPKIIVSRRCDMDDSMKSFLDDHGYNLLWAEDDSWGDGEESALVYMRDMKRETVK